MGKIIDGDSQCPLCGSVVMSDAIDQKVRITKYPFVHGMYLGAVGAITFAVAILAFVQYYPGAKQKIALYIMNHWI